MRQVPATKKCDICLWRVVAAMHKMGSLMHVMRWPLGYIQLLVQVHDIRAQANHALQQARVEIAAADHRADQAEKQVKARCPTIPILQHLFCGMPFLTVR